MNMPRSGEKSGIGGQGGVKFEHRGTKAQRRERISHAENAENAERGEPIGG